MFDWRGRAKNWSVIVIGPVIAAMRRALWEGGLAAVQASDDPMIKLALRLDPVRTVLRAPVEVGVELEGFFTRHRLLQKERDELLAERTRLRLDAEAARDLTRENTALRALLGLRDRPGQRTVQAALLYQGHDWFAQRITLDRGASAGLTDGLPVIDGAGLLGQLTRVYAGSSELTLVSSPEQLTPVYIERTGQRGLAVRFRTVPARSPRCAGLSRSACEGVRAVSSGPGPLCGHAYGGLDRKARAVAGADRATALQVRRCRRCEGRDCARRQCRQGLGVTAVHQ